MKKTKYQKPEISTIEIKATFPILAGSDQTGKGDVHNFGSGGDLSKRARFMEDDIEDYEPDIYRMKYDNSIWDD